MPPGPFWGPPPGVSQVLPPSLERWMTCPIQPLVGDAKIRFGSAGDPFMWYTSQPVKWGPLMSHFDRLPSAVMMNAPLRVPTSTRTLLILRSFSRTLSLGLPRSTERTDRSPRRQPDGANGRRVLGPRAGQLGVAAKPARSVPSLRPSRRSPRPPLATKSPSPASATPNPRKPRGSHGHGALRRAARPPRPPHPQDPPPGPAPRLGHRRAHPADLPAVERGQVEGLE